MSRRSGPASVMRQLYRLARQSARPATARSVAARRSRLIPLAYGLAHRRLLAAGARSEQVSVGDQALHLYRLAEADGPPLLLLHGLADRAATWSLVLPQLRRLGPLIAPDLPGFGSSPPPPGCRAATITHHVAVVIGLIEQECGRPAVLIGSSMGGWIAARVAAERPDLIGGLILLDPGGAALNGLRSWMPFLHSLLLEDRPARRKTLASLYAHVPLPLAVNPDFLVDLFHQSNVLDLLVQLKPGDLLHADELARIAAPTLLIWGAQDRLLPTGSAEFFARGIARSTTCELPNCGHLPQQEHPFRTARMIRSFVTELVEREG